MVWILLSRNDRLAVALSITSSKKCTSSRLRRVMNSKSMGLTTFDQWRHTRLHAASPCLARCTSSNEVSFASIGRRWSTTRESSSEGRSAPVAGMIVQESAGRHSGTSWLGMARVTSSAAGRRRNLEVPLTLAHQGTAFITLMRPSGRQVLSPALDLEDENGVACRLHRKRRGTGTSINHERSRCPRQN